MFSEHLLPVVHIKIQLTIHNSPHIPVIVLQKITVLQEGTFGICCSLLATAQFVSNIATPFAAAPLWHSVVMTSQVLRKWTPVLGGGHCIPQSQAVYARCLED
jgi:hypothetical protein